MKEGGSRTSVIPAVHTWQMASEREARMWVVRGCGYCVDGCSGDQRAKTTVGALRYPISYILGALAVAEAAAAAAEDNRANNTDVSAKERQYRNWQ